MEKKKKKSVLLKVILDLVRFCLNKIHLYYSNGLLDHLMFNANIHLNYGL